MHKLRLRVSLQLVEDTETGHNNAGTIKNQIYQNFTTITSYYTPRRNVKRKIKIRKRTNQNEEINTNKCSYVKIPNNEVFFARIKNTKKEKANVTKRVVQKKSWSQKAKIFMIENKFLFISVQHNTWLTRTKKWNYTKCRDKSHRRRQWHTYCYKTWILA